MTSDIRTHRIDDVQPDEAWRKSPEYAAARRYVELLPDAEAIAEMLGLA